MNTTPPDLLRASRAAGGPHSPAHSPKHRASALRGAPGRSTWRLKIAGAAVAGAFLGIVVGAAGGGAYIWFDQRSQTESVQAATVRACDVLDQAWEPLQHTVLNASSGLGEDERDALAGVARDVWRAQADPKTEPQAVRFAASLDTLVETPKPKPEQATDVLVAAAAVDQTCET